MDSVPGRMGYDRNITVFSPDGRIMQVEYARKTVNQGTPALGIVFKDGVALIAVKKIIDKLIVVDSVEKISIIDDHIGVTMAGLIGDGRVLIERAQKIAQRHTLTYNERVGIINITKEICNFKQAYTQYGGTRPYGVSLLIAGLDDKPRLFVTEPSGIYFEYKATAIGDKNGELISFLEKNYKENLSRDEAVKLGLKTLKAVLKEGLDDSFVDIGYITTESGKFLRYSPAEIKKLK